jgi:hypothetical protein
MNFYVVFASYFNKIAKKAQLIICWNSQEYFIIIIILLCVLFDILP